MLRAFRNLFPKKILLPRLAMVLLPILVVIFGTVPAFSSLLRPGYFTMHDDLQAMRQLEMSKCFQDLQIPCRWVPDMGYGYGYPLFNYYPPMPYYLGQFFHFLGFSILDTTKILSILAILLSSLMMYFFAKEFWGKLGGIVSALFYVWGPYHAVDVYVRGALNESWALVWFPAILLSIYKLIATGRYLYIIPLSFFTAMLMLSHNPMLLVFTPGAVAWAFFWVWRERSPTSLLKLLAAAFWALSLAAFFTIPVIFEQKFAHVESMLSGYFNYLAHFATLKELFISVGWGYGASLFGPKDDMSFHLGYLHWIIAVLSPLIAFWLFKKNRTLSYLILFFFCWSFGYTFLTHERSTPIWKLLPVLQYLQFPWRILGLSLFGMSFLAGSLTLVFSKLAKIKFILAGIILAVLIYMNNTYFTWGKYLPQVTDESKFSGDSWRAQQTSAIFDYLPIWAPMPPAEPPKGNAEFILGNGNYKTVKKNSNFQEYIITTETGSSLFQINSFYFPGWRVFVNGKEAKVDPKKDKYLGRVVVELDKGESKITMQFGETLLRLISDVVSLVAWLALLVMLFFETNKRLNFKKTSLRILADLTSLTTLSIFALIYLKFVLLKTSKKNSSV